MNSDSQLLNYGRQGRSRFLTTNWSVVLRAGGPNSDEARDSLGKLAETYWYPLYAFARRNGQNDHDAMDLTQGFFEHLLRNQALDSLSPVKGRFRAFLLTSFKNFAANVRRAAQSVRRGGSVSTISLGNVDFEARYNREQLAGESPDRIFERSWVASLLKRVHMQLQSDYQRAGKTELFELLEPHLMHRDEALSRADICRRTNLSAAAVAMSLHRMRRRYGELLREEIAATLDNPAEIDDELRALMAIISK